MSSIDVSFCSDITGLKDFLRLSRALVDDTITQNLNNLVLPARFDPTSTGVPSTGEQRILRSPIDTESCNALVDTVFQNWQSRSHTIDQCLLLSTTQPHRILQQSSPSKQQIQELNRQRRLDPYAGSSFVEEPIMNRVLASEQSTEKIVRDRTWRILRNRCQALSGLSADWESAFESWQRRHTTSEAAAN